MSQAIEEVERFTKGGAHVPPSRMSTRDLFAEIVDMDEKNRFSEKLLAFSKAMQHVDLPTRQNNSNAYYIIVVNPIARRVMLYTYGTNEYEEAAADYARLEQENAGTMIDQVLVSVKNMKALKKAFPNYFVDVEQFIEYIRDIKQVMLEKRQ